VVSFSLRVAEQFDRIKMRNAQLNALLYVRDRSEVLEESKLIEERIACGSAGKLAGRTVVIKANINAVGFPVSCASKVLESYRGTYDADVIERIRAEDGLIIGVANCDEFACGASGTHSAFGPTRNPIDETRIPGGSSSGSAVAVAAGFCDVALGTDTGGSVRNPASHCGVVAIKPSYGRVSRHGIIDLSMSLDQVGPIARDVEDALLVLEAIAGYSENDATTFDGAVVQLSQRSKRELRFAVLDVSELDIDPEVSAVFDASVRKLEAALGSFERVTIPEIPLSVATYYPLVYTEFYSATRRFDGRRYGLAIDEHAGAEVLRRIRAGARITHAEDEHRFYRKALSVKAKITASFERAFETFDVILSPVVPAPARRIDAPVSPEDEYGEDALTIPANLAGLCAASMPAGEALGVPIGIQLIARSLGEAYLAEGMRQVSDALQ
jgi:aspartyl-tRNA(Asn)/glutamyl-tRNA(Gln) amidotransferase subunit A